MTKIDQLLKHAKEKCQSEGGNFTVKRRDVLKALMQAENPLSAYELVEKYNETNEQSIQPMSVYRILNFFVEMDLVHKLTSSNKYIVCSHLACQHKHHEQYFVACNTCGAVKEMSMTPELISQIKESAQSVGYHLTESQFELYGVCDKCYEGSQAAK